MGLAGVLDCVKKYGTIQTSCEAVLPCGTEADCADAACTQQAVVSFGWGGAGKVGRRGGGGHERVGA